ncbi:TonB-dependent receptor plug domain-containing protein [Pelagicoccus mobilis]|uniref:TonB-dependent receptor plug domain-containing protein n=1 Tax=Pelagicoccus mobilis TaxID=415221 RepID=A0A934VLT5_9BACT|nr:TonB-dependent receptor plug domain-containing protein [Pelagicoccus mobilis]MBK1878106.1 TonB-dependent receptor plug domain-containing protein [Pelagicoccus mobilis]
MESKIAARLSQTVPGLATLIGVASIGTPFVLAQDVEDDEVYELSPFTVDASEDTGYRATSTLAGTRLKSSLKDVGSSISVMTGEFLSDTGSNNAEDLLVYAPSTEVAGQGGNFLGEGSGPNLDPTIRREPVSNTRVRGLSAADNTRNFYLSDIPWDSYNVTRIDLQRGPNSILFGIGSPAGIVNAGLQGASFENEGKVGVDFGSYGSLRLTGNFNRVLIEDELAVRVALLNDERKYRQDPAFRDDQRVFGALDWRPKSLSSDSYNTELSANFETGEVDSNRPRLTPPTDAITPWFNSELNKGTFEGPTATQLNNDWLGAPGQRVWDGVVNVFDPDQQGSFVTSISRWPNPDAGIDSSVSAGDIVGIQAYNNYATNAGLYGSSIGAFKSKSLTDTSIFDFRNQLIEGPNKSEFNEFDSYNVTFRQNFFDNKFGYELAYDKQSADWGYQTFLASDAAVVTVDVMETLMDGSPNPNVGRPFTIGGGGSAQGYIQNRDREVMRATAYGQIDFTESANDSLARILGKHVFTALYSTNEIDDVTRTWSPWFLGQGYGPNNTSAIGQAARDAIVYSYLGDSLAGASSAAGAHIGRIQNVIVPQSSTVRAWDNSANQWVNTPLEIVHASGMSEMDRPYRTASKLNREIDSYALVWQGYLFDGNFVPMVGYREDEDTATNAGNPPGGSLPGTIDFNDPNWVIPSSGGNREKGDSLTTSGVLHMPKSFKDKLGFDLSFHYSKSENFQPDASRIDVFGTPVASPNGETEDYGFTVSAFEDRLILKVTEYETIVRNSTAGGSIGGNYLIGAVEAWGQKAAIDALNGRGSFSTVFGTSSSGEDVVYRPARRLDGDDDVYTQAELDEAYAIQSAAINAWLADPVPGNFQDAWALGDYANGAGVTNFGPAGLVVTADTISKGTEFELIYNPTENLTISFNASETSAKQENLAAGYTEWVQSRWDDFANTPQGDIRLWGPGPDGDGGESARGKYSRETMAGLNFWTALLGSDVPELVKWRYNAVVNYTFTDGRFDGLNIGGSLRTQDAPTVGFPVIDDADGNQTYDVPNPYKGDSETNVDFWVGYETSLSDRIDWRVQLNLRNAFESSELYPVTVQPNGSAGTFRIGAPTTWTISNTFSF